MMFAPRMEREEVVVEREMEGARLYAQQASLALFL